MDEWGSAGTSFRITIQTKPDELTNEDFANQILNEVLIGYLQLERQIFFSGDKITIIRLWMQEG